MTRLISLSLNRSMQSSFALIAGMLLCHPGLQAQMEMKQGDYRHTIASVPGKSIPCGGNTFLTAISETQTDRLIGIGFDCVLPTKSQTWDTNQYAHSIGIGNIRGGAISSRSCPPDYFIVGLTYTFGRYVADSHGAAQANPAPMIADLAPVCRNRLNQIYKLPRGPLTQAEDNQLSEVAWDGIGGARSCRAGWAAMRIDFEYDSRRGIDPANPFFDAAITCRRLPIDIGKIGSHIP